MLADDSSGTAVLNCGLNTKNIASIGAVADNYFGRSVASPHGANDASGMSGFFCIEAYRAFCMDGATDIGFVVAVDNKRSVSGYGISERFIAIDATADAANNIHLIAVNVVDGDVSGYSKVSNLSMSGAAADEADVAAGVGNAVVGYSVVVALDLTGKICAAAKWNYSVVPAVNVVHDSEGARAEF